jgi:hypothetical protein
MPATHIITLGGLALMTALHLHAETIDVYFDDHAGVPAAETYRAKNKAAAIFAAAGLQIAWRSGKLKPIALGEQPPVHVRIVSHWPSADHRRALAFAMAYEGVHITVFHDRVQEAIPEAPEMGLAYVLVHEITHILQGLSRHSETGLMKARWDWAEHYSIRWGLLGLSPEDIELIHVGLAARASRMLMAARVVDDCTTAPPSLAQDAASDPDTARSLP